MERAVQGALVVVAHSGCLGTPPNSIASIEAARGAGATAIEFDVQATADGEPVLVHDPWLVQDGGERISIETITGRAKLYDNGRRIPTLQSVVSACERAGLILNLDIKTLAALPRVCGILEDTGYLDQTFLTGCDFASRSRGADPGRVRTFINLDAEIADGSFVQILTHLESLRFSGINVEHTRLDRRVVHRARDAGLLVATWTVDTREAIETVRTMGCDYITTNYPDRVMEQKR